MTDMEHAIERAAQDEANRRHAAAERSLNKAKYAEGRDYYENDGHREGFVDGAEWAVEQLRAQGVLAPAPLTEEQRSAHTVRETAAHYANRLQRLRDQIMDPSYRRSVVDAIALESAEQFLDRIARDDLDVFAVDRAEGDGRADQ